MLKDSLSLTGNVNQVLTIFIGTWLNIKLRIEILSWKQQNLSKKRTNCTILKDQRIQGKESTHSNRQTLCSLQSPKRRQQKMSEITNTLRTIHNNKHQANKNSTRLINTANITITHSVKYWECSWGKKFRFTKRISRKESQGFSEGIY